jgi:hypothetical protein
VDSKFGGTSAVYASGQEEHVSPLFLAAAAQGGVSSQMQEQGVEEVNIDVGKTSSQDLKRLGSFEVAVLFHRFFVSHLQFVCEHFVGLMGVFALPSKLHQSSF